MSYMSRMMEHFKEDADRSAMIDVATGKTLTYGELDDLTSRVYAYLTDKGIGKEQFVMINLPRSIYTFVAIIGVWRAGAAYVIVEEGTPEKKKEYIYKSCGCSLVIGHDEFARILSTPGKDGYEQTDLHDASYAVYTSGTSGSPKGVVHEYGTLEDCVAHFKYEGEYLLCEDDRLMTAAPLSFVAPTIGLIVMTYLGATLVMAPKSVLKDKDMLLASMADHKITAMFLTPSLLKLNLRFPPALRILFLASEPAKNIYIDNITLYNIYGQSETGYLAGVFKLDKAYDITPIGKSQCPDRELLILDDSGEKAAVGEIGELCFENPYFRGYVNLPEDNARVLRGGLYHTGDMGRMLPDGNIVLLGRADDMVKVNGNRVEPAEIEKAMKDVLHLSWTAAKAFVDEDRVFICGYYTDDVEFDHLEAKSELSRKLPKYMVPTHFIRLAEIPLNANGKLSRKDLPKPDLTVRTSSYAEPENDMEKRLCDAMMSVLNIDKVGALDDFYELGGDSIGSIQLLAKADIEGLTTDIIFRGRNARQIAAIYQKEVAGLNNQNLHEQEKRARRQEHHLLMEQMACYDYQLFAPKTTMWNIPLFFRLGEGTDLHRLASAVERVLEAHGVFSTVLAINDSGDVVQKYSPDMRSKVEIEQLSETELVDVRESLVRPYKLIGIPLYRVRIFKTERCGYLFIDMHHIISDGTSMYILLKDLTEAYEGKEIKEDCYYANLQRLEKESVTDVYAKAREYYTNRESAHEWSCYPKPDHNSSSVDIASISFPLPVSDRGYAKLKELYSLGKNSFFVGMAALALAAYNDAEHISILWTYNGRKSREEENIIGMLIRDITFYVDLTEGMTVGDYLKEVRDQMVLGLSYSSYQHANFIRSNSLCVIYQSGLGKTEDGGLKLIEEKLPQHYAANDNTLDLEIYDNENGTDIELIYIPSLYEEASMQRFRRMIMKTATLLVRYADEPDHELDRIISVIKEKNR